MTGGCLILLYDFMEKEYKWKTGRIPIFVGRMDQSASEIKPMLGSILEQLHIPGIKMVILLDETEKTIADLDEMYENFAIAHRCQIEWNISTIRLGERQPSQTELDDDNTLMIVFYGPPLLSSEIDLQNEPTQAVFLIENTITSAMIDVMIQELEEKGLTPKEWHIFPYTEDGYAFFKEATHNFAEKVTACIACMRDGGRPTARCGACVNAPMADYAEGLMNNGIIDVYFDSDEISLSEPDDE